MLELSPQLELRFNALLDKKKLPLTSRFHYKKWLRYYLDFCHKYHFNKLDKQSLSHFINKLQSKKQNKQKQKEAFHAVSIYYKFRS